ncbi:ABC transporter substrate-binding protein [Paenibacillus eucommiae]|uniref:Iron complex transport system substrate-binding protein n=1 Tax=Paenibacillus eucommiae TaxID=1355755 RepID=A0ABS4IX45_9BACL|nr:ABC transporter substrate-binding protein [Paenibacillus eucommiae]MBP1992083.1 iron complex transport system substrate-binding protein [Paenibacillus eucommiae]
MRNYVSSIMLLLCITLLCACGSQTQSNTIAPTATGSNAAKETAAVTKKYTDFEGREVTLPANPQKIVVAAGSGAVIDLLELGYEPLGYPHRYLQNSSILKPIQDRLSKQAPDIGMPTNLETVLSLSPELIILGYETQTDEYNMLSKIGPVATFDESLPLKDRLTTIGEVVGKEKEAQAIINELEGKTEKMFQSLREQGKIGENETAAVVVYYWNKQMYLMKNFGLFDLINHPLGYKMSEKVASLNPINGSPYIEISEEAMPGALIADRLFILYDNNVEAKEGFKQLRESLVFKNLEPVKNGKVHYIPLEYNDSDVVATRKLIEDFPKILETDMFE